METAPDLLPGRLLRGIGPPSEEKDFRGVQIDDERLSMVLSPDAPLLTLYEGTLHGEGPAWQAAHDRLVWSDVPNRRLLGWYPDGHVEVLIDGTWFMNGNAVEADGTLVHCEHGRRCISRGGDYDREPEPIVTHYQGKRINSPNDIAVAPDGTIWFTDPTFGIIMPNQGALAEPELDHRSVYRFDPQTGDLKPDGGFRGAQRSRLHRRWRDALRVRHLAVARRGSRTYSRNEARNHRLRRRARTARFRTGASSATPTTAIPTDLRSMRAAGCGRVRRTACISGQPIGASWASCQRPRSSRTAPSGAPDGRRLFIAATQYLLAIDLIG